ncbi:hypothetical protein [Geomicrobium sp. JCM 19037]|uniref:hypothetical protein n=1 Tax=Geomicrobium sp. JCM 19037 TaxID=1460634 RepID=UPI0005A8A28F|nr:hypothetical protein [Geomicrobium sp. JCM 19037]
MNLLVKISKTIFIIITILFLGTATLWPDVVYRIAETTYLSIAIIVTTAFFGFITIMDITRSRMGAEKITPQLVVRSLLFLTAMYLVINLVR